ncbi:hypothetical protein [Streptomyces bicolor]|uniref:hypothetical protein n=1 Tax=Streptomyces bicolor TaxID=66874 RepID=UPI0004E20739|nr:hypothetical protein [Streptomyces bicolor]
MTPDPDLDALLARLPQKSPTEAFAEIEAARRAAEAAPWPEPSIIPMPSYPYGLRHPLAGTVRFDCPLGCGWHHDENPALEPLGPLLLSVDTAKLSEAITQQANARAEALRTRVEEVITEHFVQAHPDR